MKNFLILIMLLFTINGFSQNGYVNGFVVKNNGDTLKGRIYSPGWDVTPKQIRFRQGNAAEEQFSASQIRSFSITGVDNYISSALAIDNSPVDDNSLLSVDSSILKTDTIFLRVVVNGTASLYYYRGPDQKQHFFIGKNDAVNELIWHRYKITQNDIQYVKEDKKFIGQLTYYMSDCPEMRNTFDNLKYSESSLQPIFVSYANCKGSTNTFIAKQNSISARLGVLAGASISSVTFKGPGFQGIEDVPFKSTVAPVFGVKLDFYLVPKNKNYSLYDDLEFQPVSFTGHGTSSSSGVFFFDNTYKINVDYLFLNTMFRYYFSQGDLKPFINGGIANAFAVKTNEDSVIAVETAPSGKTTLRNGLFTITGRESGLEIGGGVMWKKFTIDLRDIYWSGITRVSGFSCNINTIQILAGYQF